MVSLVEYWNYIVNRIDETPLRLTIEELLIVTSGAKTFNHVFTGKSLVQPFDMKKKRCQLDHVSNKLT